MILSSKLLAFSRLGSRVARLWLSRSRERLELRSERILDSLSTGALFNKASTPEYSLPSNNYQTKLGNDLLVSVTENIRGEGMSNSSLTLVPTAIALLRLVRALTRLPEAVSRAVIILSA